MFELSQSLDWIESIVVEMDKWFDEFYFQTSITKLLHVQYVQNINNYTFLSMHAFLCLCSPHQRMLEALARIHKGGLF